MRETLIVVAFLPFLYYATLDGIFHFRGRRVSLSEHVIHVVIGLSLALVFTAAVMANQPVMLGSLVAFLAVSYTHLRAHETDSYLVCRLLLE